MVGLLLGLGKKNEKHPCGKVLARVRAKIEEIIFYFLRALVRVRAKIEKNTLFGRAFVRILSKKRGIHPFW